MNFRSISKQMVLAFVIASTMALTLISPSVIFANESAAIVQTVSGTASWYGQKFHGRRTASGERFNMHELTAAHRSLPFGTKVRVTNRQNGRSVVVRINDRGPFAGKRIIDLSRKAASQIGMINKGTASVQLEIMG